MKNVGIIATFLMFVIFGLVAAQETEETEGRFACFVIFSGVPGDGTLMEAEVRKLSTNGRTFTIRVWNRAGEKLEIKRVEITGKTARNLPVIETFEPKDIKPKGGGDPIMGKRDRTMDIEVTLPRRTTIDTITGVKIYADFCY